MTQTQTTTNWQLKGTVLIACNCDYGCPCNFNALPTRGDCEGAWTWHIEQGQVGDVRLDGLNFAAAADWPAAIHQGNGEATILVDERADERQREAILTLLSGKAGGPWAIIGATLSKVHGPHFVPFDLKLDKERTTLRAGNALTLEMEPIRNPKSGAEVHPGAILPEGFIFKQGQFAASKVFCVDDGVSYDHSGKYAAFAPFEYKGP
ncbi:MAG: DUF1326 domain-containing protein [Chloroflexi bacterium]|nr:DUF1326 domain-containing protein [Chloroflexota bacterium]